MVLADVLVGQDKTQVDSALRILESAAGLRPDRPRAYHLKRASLLDAKNDATGAEAELAEALLVAPKNAFDYYLIGQVDYKRRRFADAIDDFEMALRGRPDHFWARCLQAICFIETKNFDAAKSNLVGCLQAEPDSAWLYLLRGFASGQLGVRDLNLIKVSPGRESNLKKARNPSSIRRRQIFKPPSSSSNAPPMMTSCTSSSSIAVWFDSSVTISIKPQPTTCRPFRIKEDPNAHANLAFVYQKQGKIDEAIAQFGEAIALKPDWAALYRGRADLLQDRPDSAPEHRARRSADLKLAIHNENDDKSRSRP